MAQFFAIHPTHPQKRLIRQAADIVRHGGVIAYPTDSCYALGCDRANAKGLERLRRIRAIDERHSSDADVPRPRRRWPSTPSSTTRSSS